MQIEDLHTGNALTSQIDSLESLIKECEKTENIAQLTSKLLWANKDSDFFNFDEFKKHILTQLKNEKQNKEQQFSQL